jgi:hypothetical protein
MPNPNKLKGDRAELEAAALLRDHLGIHARRAFGAGRGLDEGDLVGVPYTSVQIVNSKHIADAVRNKPLEAERQRLNAHNPYAVTFVRLRGGDFRCVQTFPQWAAMYRECL